MVSVSFSVVLRLTQVREVCFMMRSASLVPAVRSRSALALLLVALALALPASATQRGVLRIADRATPLRHAVVLLTFSTGEAVIGRTVRMISDENGTVTLPVEALAAGTFLVEVPAVSSATHHLFVPREHDVVRWEVSPRDWRIDDHATAQPLAEVQAAATSSQTKTFDIDCWNNAFPIGDGNNCDFCTGTIQPNHVFTYSCSEGAQNWMPTCSYTDTLLGPTVVTKVEAVVDMKDCSGQRGYSDTVFSVDLNGTMIAPEHTLSINNCGCVGQTCLLEDFLSTENLNGFTGYVPGGMNTFGFDIATGAICVEKVTLTLTYQPFQQFDFSITDAAPAEDRHVILSNLHSGYQYPRYQALGGQDSAVPMFVRARGPSRQYEAGLTVYLRVDDPADSAAYMNLSGNVLAHANDNDGPAALLDGNGITASATAGVYQATSGANGEIDFTLRLQSGTAAGDNYQIEASFDPTFPAGATTKSGMLTAWKRVFVEKHLMLRNGMFLTRDAHAGETTIRVNGNHYNGNQGRHRLSAGDQIVLVHGPALDRRNALLGMAIEYHSIADVQAVPNTNDYIVTLGTRQGHTIQAEQLLHDFGPDPSDPATLELGDAIARPSGSALSGLDYFNARDSLLAQYDANGQPSSAFSQAFTEYVVLPDGPFGFVPVPRMLSSTETLLQHFADKWSLSVSTDGAGGGICLPNHQLLIVGDTDGSNPPSEVGQTTQNVGAEVASYVFRGAIDFAVTNHNQANPHNGQNPDNWAAKNEAHELGHQWELDSAWAAQAGVSLGHCPSDSTAFDDASTYCLMATADPAKSETQSDNLIAKFHLRKLPSGDWDSEYFEIRQRTDPFVP